MLIEFSPDLSDEFMEEFQPIERILRYDNAEDLLADGVSLPGEMLMAIETGREQIQAIILEKSKERVTDLGIDILDVRFKRINYVEEVRRKVYDRMIAERKRIADRFRSEGEGEAARIRGERDRDLDRIQSEAYRTAQSIIGEADAEATRIFAEAYDQSAESRSFYEFVRTMETYRETIDESTSLLLSTDGDFARFLQSTER